MYMGKLPLNGYEAHKQKAFLMAKNLFDSGLVKGKMSVHQGEMLGSWFVRCDEELLVEFTRAGEAKVQAFMVDDGDKALFEYLVQQVCHEVSP